MLFRLLPYHLRLAVRSLRRDPGLSATIILVMAVPAGIFCTALMHYMRVYGGGPPLPPGLHQVEVVYDDHTLERAFAVTSGGASSVVSHTRLSFPDYRVMASSGIPSRHTASFRTRLLVGRAAGGPPLSDTPLARPDSHPRPRNARFVDADFFGLFARRFRWGSTWSAADERAGRKVAVVSKLLNAQLFGGENSIGQTLFVDNQPHLVIGVLAEHQPTVPEWDLATSNGGQDAVYLPFGEHEQLASWPETPLPRAPHGPDYGDLLGSKTIFVSYWLELPTAESRRAYLRFLDERFGQRGARTILRDIATLRIVFRPPATAVSFFTFLTLIILVGGGLIMSRLLLAKGLARGDELGIFRALGAPRGTLFVRQVIEAAILAGLAAVASLGISVPQAAYYNDAVRDTDIPIGLTGRTVLVTFLATLTVGVLAALYPGWRAAARQPTVALGRR